jgi:hypothetical protein
LISVALEELVRQRCELPGHTTLDALAAGNVDDMRNTGDAKRLTLLVSMLLGHHDERTDGERADGERAEPGDRHLSS